MLKPHREEIQCSVKRLEHTKHLNAEVTEDLRLAEPGDGEESDSVEMLVTVPARLEVGKRDLVADSSSQQLCSRS